MRRKYKYYEQRDFRGGINQNEEGALSGQLRDAMNVWCPDGVLSQRPGYRGIGLTYTGSTLASSTETIIKEDVSTGTFTNYELAVADLSDLEEGDRWYYGFEETLPAGSKYFSGFIWVPTNANTATIYTKCEYYNGTGWTYVPSYELLRGVVLTTTYSETSTHLEAVGGSDYLAPIGADLSTGTVNGLTKYFVRFTLHGDGFATDGNVTVNPENCFIRYLVPGSSSETHFPIYGCCAQLSSQSMFVFMRAGTVGSNLFIAHYSTPFVSVGYDVYLTAGFGTYPARILPSCAIVKEFDQCFIAYSGVVYLVKSEHDDTAADYYAKAEDSESIVGTGAPFDRNYVAQMDAFPEANIITFFNGQLWAAGIVGQPSTIRWSAPIPAHTVWPEVSFEYLIEDDNSGITGMSSLNEQLIVFKRDSIWRMVHNGFEADTGLNSYTPVKEVSGVGCSGHSTIAKTPDGLIFLSEDGVYRYTGSAAAHKISGAIDDTIARISRTTNTLATAVYWKTRQCYLIAVPLDGSAVNTHVLVYECANKHYDERLGQVGSWWIWDNMPVVSWIVAESPSDREVLYFLDDHYMVMQLDQGDTDHGATISSYIETHRIGNDRTTKRAREIVVHSTNKVSSLAIEAKGDDREFSSSGHTISSTDPSGAETGIDELVFDTDGIFTPKKYRKQRLSVREDGDWFRVKVSNANKGQRMEIRSLAVGVKPLGVR